MFYIVADNINSGLIVVEDQIGQAGYKVRFLCDFHDHDMHINF